MPRFSLKRLLISTTMVATGLGALVFAFSNQLPLLDYPAVTFLYVAPPALIGAGLLHPFRLAWVGALVGALGMLIFLGYCVATVEI